MKKKLVMIGITLVLIIIGFSGCEEQEENREGIPVMEPNYHIYALTYIDSCSSVDPQAPPGTVWVNYSVTNYGGRRNAVAYAQVYQGIGEYEWCGNGTIYNQTKSQFIKLDQNGNIALSFVFTGVDCTQGSNCYGVKSWIVE